MKSILVKVELQFDSFDDEVLNDEKNVNDYVSSMLNEFNSTLQERHSDVCPQLFGNNISDEDIEISNQE